MYIFVKQQRNIYFFYIHIGMCELFITIFCANLKTGATSGARTAYPSGAPEFTPRFLVGFVLLDL